MGEHHRWEQEEDPGEGVVEEEESPQTAPLGQEEREEQEQEEQEQEEQEQEEQEQEEASWESSQPEESLQ